ncbi:MAG: hypothetical protein PSX81_09790 [bacterium]|nr:hypothetical protein [bacterium]
MKTKKSLNKKVLLNNGVIPSEKTNEDFNKMKPDPKDPNEEEGQPDVIYKKLRVKK